MANLNRVRVEITGGGVVGPSVSTFFFSDGHTGFNADLIAFYSALVTRLPSITTWTVPGDGDVIDEVTGALVGSWTDGTTTSIAGTGTAQNPSGVGCRIVWLTSAISGGRRLRGSTFMIPLDASMYDTLGTLSAGRSDVQTAAQTLVTASAGEMKIWTRPVGGAGGGSASVTGATVPDRISTLRSRRV